MYIHTQILFECMLSSTQYFHNKLYDNYNRIIIELGGIVPPKIKISWKRPSKMKSFLNQNRFVEILHYITSWPSLLWCFYFKKLFGFSFWRHPFAAEDTLVRAWCNMLHFSKSVQMKKQTHLGWPEDEQIFSKCSSSFRIPLQFKYYNNIMYLHCKTAAKSTIIQRKYQLVFKPRYLNIER